MSVRGVILVIIAVLVAVECKRKAYFMEDTNSVYVRYFKNSSDWSVITPKTCPDCDPYDSQFLRIKKMDYEQISNRSIAVMQFQNYRILDYKISMYRNLLDLDKQRLFEGFSSASFVPQTFPLEVKDPDRKTIKKFLESNVKGIWILKPSGQLQGKGIQMVHNVKEFKEQVQNNSYPFDSTHYVIQKYLENPLLLGERKFDIRSYCIVVSSDPFIVLFRHGVVRRSVKKFELDNPDKFIHLSNTAIYKEQKTYAENRDEAMWTMQQLEGYLKTHYKLSEDQIEQIYTQMKAQITYTFLSVKDKFRRGRGVFQLFGQDTIIDDNFRPYLLEVNGYPDVTHKQEAKKYLIPEMIRCFFDTSFYLFDNHEHIQSIAQDESKLLQFCPKEFSVLINEATGQNFIKDNLEKITLKKKAKKEHKDDL